jgi:hypothetical protein
VRDARRLLVTGIMTLGMCASIGLGAAGCTPNDAPGEPRGPDRAHQEELHEEMHQQHKG